MVGIDKGDLEGPKIDRRTTLKLLSAAGLGGIAGCTGQDDQGQTPTQGGDGNGDTPTTSTGGVTEAGTPTATATPATQVPTGGTVEVGVPAEQIVELDPHMISLSHEMLVMVNLFNGLTKLNARQELVGDLATDWTIPDDTTYEFTLREGVKFHNGNEITAEKAKWSIRRVMNNPVSPHNGKTTFIKSVEAPDTYLLRINMSKPMAPFIVFTTRAPGRMGVIVPESEANWEMSADTSNFSQNPVGSGPFKYDGRSRGEVLRLSKFENYFGTDAKGNQLPYLDGINFNMIPESSTLFTALKSGGVQYASRVGSQNARIARNLPNLAVDLVGSGNVEYFTYLNSNPTHNWEERWQPIATNPGETPPPERWMDRDPPTADSRVRRAIALALDREEIVKRAYLGMATPAHTLLGPTMPWVYEAKPDNAHVYDPERAKTLLDEAGYTGSTRFSGTFITTGVFERVSTVIQEQLSRVGIDAQLEVLQNAAYWNRAYQFKDLFRMSYSVWDTDPWQRWWLQLHTPDQDLGAGLWNQSLYWNPEFDKIIEKSVATPKRDERRPIVKEAEQIFLKDAPLTPLAYPATAKARKKSLKGIAEPLGFSYFHNAYLEG